MKNEKTKSNISVFSEKCDDALVNIANDFVITHLGERFDHCLLREARELLFDIEQSLSASISQYDKALAKEINKLKYPLLNPIYILDTGTLINGKTFILKRDYKAHQTRRMLIQFINSMESAY